MSSARFQLLPSWSLPETRGALSPALGVSGGASVKQAERADQRGHYKGIERRDWIFINKLFGFDIIA